MFNDISKRYDFINHLLSGGVDKRWRKKAVGVLASENPEIILDLATGTGDFILELLKLNSTQIIGADLSEKMLAIAEKKLSKYQNVTLQIEEAEKLTFKNATFDAITVGFGVRNFSDLQKGLQEMKRVLKKNGTVVILEPGMPSNMFLKILYSIYFKFIVPVIGRLISGNKHAYSYLPDSVAKFPSGDNFIKICEKVGFKNSITKNLTFGVCRMYVLRLS